MQYFISIEGLENKKISVEMKSIFTSPELFVEGRPAAKGKKRGEFVIPKEDGSQKIVTFKNKFLDPVPDLIIDNIEFKLTEPLKWYQWLWAGLPVLLIFTGGLIGAFIGFFATSFSARIFRSAEERITQYLLVALVSISAVIVYFIVAAFLVSLFTN